MTTSEHPLYLLRDLKYRYGRYFELDSIEVRVEASSDGRGMFLDDGISAGSSEVRLHFKIGAGNASAQQIQDLVHWVERHSPVGTDIMCAVQLSSQIEIIDSQTLC